MGNVKKFMMAAAGGAGLNVEEVFSVDPYVGNGSSQTITNGIDLSTEGGMVWTKGRSNARGNNIWDSGRSLNQVIMPDQGGGGTFTESSGIGVTSFNTNGFSLGGNYYSEANSSGNTYVAWTFRKAPKFFDVVTYTGNGTNGRTISHNLGTTVGCIIVKNLSQSSDWAVYHRGAFSGVNPSHYFGKFNDTSVFSDGETYWNDTEPTDSVFTVGTSYLTNANNNNYVAYLFAHNNNDGEFGATGDQDIIKCGHYLGTASTNGNYVTLGWEPQFLIIKGSNESANWVVVDNVRGIPHNGSARILSSNVTSAETQAQRVEIFADGFRAKTNNNFTNAYNGKYTYIAIRRPMAVPTSASEVFDMHTGSAYNTKFSVNLSQVDWATTQDIVSGSPSYTSARFQGGNWLRKSSYDYEGTSEHGLFDLKYEYAQKQGGTDMFTWMWKRAPGFFDVVTWNIDGTGNQTIKHNLGVVPEMVITKNRSDNGYGSGSWWIGHNGLTGWDSSNENDRHILQNWGTAASAQQGYHRDFTSTSIRLLSNAVGGYTTSHVGIGFLFATLPGISKVGSFTHTYNTAQNIDCGFSNGASFVLLKRYDSSGSWRLYDSERGITSGNDAMIDWGDTAAQDNTANQIDIYSGGFGMRANYLAGGDYIFLAIAAI